MTGPLCACGCGQATRIATQTRTGRGYRKGEPIRFVNGAHGRRATARDLAERFWSKVQKSERDGCWLWIGGTNPNGYGCLKIGLQNRTAHRLAWSLAHGAIPDGQSVLHRCDVRRCVRPSHLFLGTHLDNMRDMYQKGRRHAASGMQNGRAKLTLGQARQIKYSESVVADSQLAKHYGVSSTSIRSIRDGRSWAEVGLS